MYSRKKRKKVTREGWKNLRRNTGRVVYRSVSYKKKGGREGHSLLLSNELYNRF